MENEHLMKKQATKSKELDQQNSSSLDKFFFIEVADHFLAESWLILIEVNLSRLKRLLLKNWRDHMSLFLFKEVSSLNKV